MKTVYHGTTTAIEYPKVDVGRPDLDFGPGFYVTTLLEQAEEWANRMARQRKEYAVVNQYQFDDVKAKAKYHYLFFEKYDEEWLGFIVSSRRGREPWKGYDCIEGGVANDRVIDMVEGFMSGTVDAAHALRELAKHQPNNQICLLSQRLTDECLQYEQSITR